MNNSLYEDYMRSVLGYESMGYRNIYNNMDFMNMSNDMGGFSDFQTEELEQCYPEIYRIVYPMVQTACMRSTRNVTRELIESMTDEIYSAIEDNEIVQNRANDKKEKNIDESRTEDRQRTRNNSLNDLIRILLLRELLGRPGFPGRPPHPPMRPPMGLGQRPIPGI